MPDTFGPSEAMQALSAPESPVPAAVDPQPEPQAPKPALKRAKRIVVDELRDVAITVVRSTVIFRPGQVLTGHLIDLAKQNGIQLREV